MILDELKLYSDDSDFNELHIRFLCSKYRALLLKQTYAKINKNIPENNKQTLCLELEIDPLIECNNCTGVYLKSKDKLPNTLPIGIHKVYPYNSMVGHNITYISPERFRFIGYNKWLKNIIYCCKGEDNYLYFKSWNPQHLHLEKVHFSGIFEDVEEASQLECGNDNKDTCIDIMDKNFPIEEALIPQLIQAVVQELANKTISPADQSNNASDDKSSLYNYMARNTKSDLAKQLS